MCGIILNFSWEFSECWILQIPTVPNFSKTLKYVEMYGNALLFNVSLIFNFNFEVGPPVPTGLGSLFHRLFSIARKQNQRPGLGDQNLLYRQLFPSAPFAHYHQRHQHYIYPSCLVATVLFCLINQRQTSLCPPCSIESTTVMGRGAALVLLGMSSLQR